MPITKGLAIALFVLLSACATPEATLKHGYELVSATTRTTTSLVNRDAISVEDAEKSLLLNSTAKTTLDTGKESLKACRATPGAKCTSALANINLGSGVLLQLEQYLKEHQ